MFVKNLNKPEDGCSMEDKIVTAAQKLFLQNGFEMTSTTQIAREAGCNQALVHYYFRTKEKLFDAVLGGRIRQALKNFFILDTGEGSFEEKLTRLIEFHYDIVKANSDMVLFLINSLTRNPGILESIIAELGDIPVQTMKSFSGELDAEIRAGRIRQVTLHDIILNVISMNAFPFAIKPVFAKVWNRSDTELDSMLGNRKEEVVKTILQGLRP